MKKLYSRHLWLPLVICIITHAQGIAQLLNDQFIPPAVYRQGEASVIKTDWNGGTYIGGRFDFHGDRPINGTFVKLKQDGLLDTSFNPQFPDNNTLFIEDIEVLQSHNVAVIGIDPNNGDRSIVVFRHNGVFLARFLESSVTAIEAASANSFYAATEGGTIIKYNLDTNESLNITQVNGSIADMQWQDEMLTVAGSFTQAWDAMEKIYYPRTLLVRFNPIGVVDKSFNANTAMQGYTDIGGIVWQSDGKLVPLKKWRFGSGFPPAMRLNRDGSRDMGFTSPFASNVAFEDAFPVFGNLMVITDTRIVRLHSNGSINSSFPPIIYPKAQVVAAALPDGSMIVGNYKLGAYGFAKFTLNGDRVGAYYARLTRYGEIYSIDRTATSMWISGDFVRVGNHFTKNVARLNLDGTVLTKFTSTITTPIRTVKGFTNARCLIQTPNRIYRLGSDGAIDPSFSYANLPGITSIHKFIVQPDDKIIVGGNLLLYRLNPNGSRDLSFNSDAGRDAQYGASMDFDLDRTTGKIIYTNWQYGEGFEKTELFRINPDGSRDASFTPPAFPENSFLLYTKVIALDNQEVLAMKPAYLLEDHTYDVVKLNADGSLNEEFTNNIDSRAHWFEYAARFGNRLILYSNRIYDDEYNTTYHAVGLDGVWDSDFRFVPALQGINTIYSDNDTELFVAGNLLANGRRYAMVKQTHTPLPAAAMSVTTTSEGESRLRFYPNPVVDKVTVEVNGPGTVNILDQTGASRLSKQVDAESETLDLGKIEPGSYVIEVITREKTYREHLFKR